MKKQVLFSLGLAAISVGIYAKAKTGYVELRVNTVDGKTDVFRKNSKSLGKPEFDFVTRVYADTATQISGYEYVDLGLPSGTLWATCNIGATNPKEIGDYFAWGETTPKKWYDWTSYKYGKKEPFTNYCTEPGDYTHLDSIIALLPEDDVATVTWGNDWKMPSEEDFRELIRNCVHSKIEDDTTGYTFTGPNGNSIYLPFSSGEENWNGIMELWRGRYWSNRVDNYSLSKAFYLEFGSASNVCEIGREVYRYEGLTVRAVSKKKISDLISRDTITYMQIKEVDQSIGDTLIRVNSVEYDVENIINVDFNVRLDTAVDLGLPSGTLWANCNIGATMPWETGDYFAWGETEPKDEYEWNTYKYAKVRLDEKWHIWGLDSLTKYNSGNRYPGVIDNLTTLLAEDDAATANWGSDWRMPTTEELQELIDNCKYEWTKVDGVDGVKFTASNGNSIFLPSANEFNGFDVRAYYWSSSLDDESEGLAHILYIGKYEATSRDRRSRDCGVLVRAVRAKK